MTDTIVKVTQEGRNDTIVRLWTAAGNQIDLKPMDPDTEFFANLVVKIIGKEIGQTT